ncbi:MAG TPA: hypothetical protein PKL24_02735 [Polyangiaceae bacterium]|nr:MAG: hypothetical protein BWY17_04389 [Deltaproteobacteria bacterium ADurb.Bin207]HNZ21030.1 hypothetical protein [Polyangiaceae bacterium]HOD24433.1 hypothetical protein [Polyangiaceae bacterium]HOE51208.1 hypothetical protein [Polyangiaceae bacterium]HOR35148.1 hypothetical protein [Polyangiaceae bacterium]
MRNTSWIVVGLAAIALAVGCTTKSEEDTGPASGGSSGGGYTPTPNGVGIGEQEACEMLRDAFDKHASRLSCTYTLPECPAYIRAGQAPVCSKYDEGTVKGCADFYAGFTSCSEFQKRPCHIMNIEGSAPTGCPDDAGVSDSEEPTEAGEPDAEEQVDGGEPDAEEQVDGGEPDAEE